VGRGGEKRRGGDCKTGRKRVENGFHRSLGSNCQSMLGALMGERKVLCGMGILHTKTRRHEGEMR
jgi:hypothetical protein